MNIKGLSVDPITNMPIIVLRETDGERVLPIWVGVFEANAIALQIESVQTPRPMTHDLLKSVIDELDVAAREVNLVRPREALGRPWASVRRLTSYIRCPPTVS